MRKLVLSLVAAPLLVGAFSVNAYASDEVTIFDNVKFKGEIRPRYEYADVKDNGKDAANAFTARTHLLVNAGLLGIENLSATVGVESVNNFGYTKYNSTKNGHTDYDVIVDPQTAYISEASIDYKMGNTAFHAGRSHVNLDNQRFIGTVGWRQNERSYDTIYVANSDVEGLDLLAAYVYGFQGVKATPTKDTKSVLLHAKYKVMPELSVTAYDYMLGSMHDTIGIALTGKVDLGSKVSYRAEYAVQKDPTLKYRDVDNSADADYMNLDLGTKISGVILGVNYEVLSGAKGDKTTFIPALGTNHKFNGWADKFYVGSAPKGGLQDANIRLGYAAKGFGKLLGVYHNYTADEKMASATGTTDDLGSEIDLLYVNAIPGVKNLKGLIKYAAYAKGEATGYTKDVNKAWVMLDYKFASN